MTDDAKDRRIRDLENKIAVLQVRSMASLEMTPAFRRELAEALARDMYPEPTGKTGDTFLERMERVLVGVLVRHLWTLPPMPTHRELIDCYASHPAGGPCEAEALEAVAWLARGGRP